MSDQYISIKATDNNERVSTIAIDDSGLRIIGNLPHGYVFNPKTIEDAEKLIAYLNDWVTVEKGYKIKATKSQQQAFIQAYMKTAIWSSSCGGEPGEIDDDTELSDAAKFGMIRHCLKFLNDNAALIEGEPDVLRNEGCRWGSAGHDFWLTREGHGAGFWDGDWPVNGDALSSSCDTVGAVGLYLGDDNFAHLGA